jgi:translation initiation factor IF-3
MGPRVNERIRVREVRVIDDEGNNLGVMSPREGVEVARSRGLDLIEVSPDANPPVCRITDYGKYKYELGKREREQAKKQRQAAELKGMTLRPGTDDHDLDFKIKNIVKFLGEGHKVKVTVRFRSREMSHPEFAQASLQKIVEAAQQAGVGQVERHPIMEGRQMIMVLAPVSGDKAPAKPQQPKPAAAPAPRPQAAAAGGDGAANGANDAAAQPPAAPAPTPAPAPQPQQEAPAPAGSAA